LERNPSSYLLVVEHDLSVLDYLSDFVCCLYGKAGAYGVVSMPYSVREGINVFLAGFIPTENLRFREEDLNFKMSTQGENFVIDTQRQSQGNHYPSMTKTMTPKKKDQQPFVLHVKAGSFTDSEIIVMLGENGTGKTTFIRMLAGLLKSDEKIKAEEAEADNLDEIGVPPLHISYKPQKISPKFPGTVADLMQTKIREAYGHPQFITDVIKPLMIPNIADNLVLNLSGGELQRVAITLCLGTPADVYLIDEPSAYLDSEQRIVCSKVIKRYILHAKKTAFIVEHDFIMATYLADRVVVYEGSPGVECTANSPEGLVVGMNRFLSHLEITFRRDPTNYRPRINKPESVKDVEQKLEGNFFFVDE
jgi:ATP-binding cassette subfamily E protein 1